MRRSAAPSQLQGSLAKKTRFRPPGKISTSDLHEKIDKQGPNVTFTETNSRSCTSVLSAVTSEESVRAINDVNKCTGNYSFKTTTEVSVDATNTALVAAEVAQSEEKEAISDHVTKYFSVVWRKVSKKKHKKWEGDAVLIVNGRSFILKDLEGKDIGRGTGYKLKDLDSLNEGEATVIGGKEIEVMGIISSDDYKSGRCFQSSLGSPCLTPSQISRKPFSNPVKSSCKSNTKEKIVDDSPNFKPRHDPYAQNSFVMPRPDKSHQWIFNKNCLPLVDVVVDPYLVHHLRPHQKEGIVFLYECVMGMRMNGKFGAILADEMGLGKTLQCISLIWTLLRQGLYGGKPIIKKTLIVTPGSLVINWKKEFQKWLGSERIKVFTVDQDHKIEDFISSPLYSVLVISYEMLLRGLDQIKNIKFDLLICDEGHRLKNSSIKTTTALVSLSCEKRIILTGTPIQNDLQEFYALIEFVNPGILGSLSSYKKIYEEPIIASREPSATQEEKTLGERRAAELTRLTGFFILRRTQEVINKYLPPKIENVVFCRPGRLQIELYRKLLDSQAVRFCLQGVLENSPHLICIGALKKLCNHPCLLFKSLKEKECNSSDEYEKYNFSESLIDAYPTDYNPVTFSETDSGKLHVLTKLLAVIRELSPSEKVVLVSNYTQTLNILQEVCKRYGYNCSRLDGQTPVVQRQQIVDGFNSKHSSDFVFLLSSKAGGVGLNLIGGSHLILYDIDWNPATDIQTMARVWRDGQKHSVHIYRLLTTGTIEEKIYQRQISKQGLSGAVVDLTKTSEHIHFSVEELKNLFTLHEDSDCVTHDLLDCECMGRKDHQAKSLEDVPTYRKCQLGPNHLKSDSKKTLSMSQLKQWKHFSGKYHNINDPFLERIKENVSFIFQNITNQVPLI
ncbi:DNA repair and recombination protein RAD54B isoform X1 [Sminthopsis crassicaudata]|uniref:DNA repair and recombination protein RAD54B isoform X1 n=1 Tax=Sminthopsis crassicaudata TaxID=9301 RepID=UPI003D6883A0